MGTLTSYPFYPPQSFPVFSNSTTVNMEVLLGLTGRDFTIIAASKAAMRGATILKSSDDKTRQLNKHTLLAFSGEPCATRPTSVPVLSRALSGVNSPDHCAAGSRTM